MKALMVIILPVMLSVVISIATADRGQQQQVQLTSKTQVYTP